MLLAVTSFTATGFVIKNEPFETTNIDDLIIDRQINSPPLPGYCPNPIPDLFIPDIKMDFDIPIRELSKENGIVIDLLTQLNEGLYLGFLEDLVAFGPRVTGTTACWQAGDWIYSEFEDMGLGVRYQNWSYSGYSGHNIEGTIEGYNESSDEIYIICAHYDTVSGSPGADDDGSGVAAVLTAAYLMKDYPFEHTVRFVTFDGEEEGLLGSHEYVEEAYNNGDNIIGTLNADMIGNTNTQNGGNFIKIYENTASSWLTDFTDDISNFYDDYIGINIVPSGSSSGSDHYYLWQFGYDAIFYHEYEFSPVYHSPQDTIANMNVSYATKSSKLILATLAELAIPGMLSDPPYAPTISGPSRVVYNKEYSYSFLTSDPNGDDIFYYVDWGDDTNSGWVGPYTSGQQSTITKAWDTIGTYTILARAKDTFFAVGDWSTPFTVEVVENQPPDIPDISGPTSGTINTSYLYTFESFDNDGDDIYYYIDWGDGEFEEWIGPFESGESGGIHHLWEKEGTYTIKIKAKDTIGDESNWGTLEVSMPVNKMTTQGSFIQKILSIFPNAFPILRYILGI